MARQRVVMVAMPCAEVVEVDGALDIFYAANLVLGASAASDVGYDVEVVSPATTVRAWAGLTLVADRSYRSIRGAIDTLIVTGIDGPDDVRREPDLLRWLVRTAPRAQRLVGLCTGSFVLAEAGLLDGRRATTGGPEEEIRPDEFLHEQPEHRARRLSAARRRAVTRSDTRRGDRRPRAAAALRRRTPPARADSACGSDIRSARRVDSAARLPARTFG